MGHDVEPDAPVVTEDDETSNEDTYVTPQQRRLGLFALRYTAPPALVTALIFAAINYLIIMQSTSEPLSWYGIDGQSFLKLYLPSAFILPIIQTPLLLRRTLQLRIKGRLEPPLDATLEQLPWLQWSIVMGLIAGGVCTAILMTAVTIVAV